MIIHEGGAVKALNAAYKKGYEIAPLGAGLIGIYTECWALEIPMRDLPLKVSQTLVEHLGHIPVVPEFCQKNRENQTMMEAEIKDRQEELNEGKEHACQMRRLPLTFQDRWRLYMNADGAVSGYDEAHLGLIDWEKSFPACLMQDNGNAEFMDTRTRLVVAKGDFGRDDEKRLWQIAKLYETVRPEDAVAAENMCLFDDMERE